MYPALEVRLFLSASLPCYPANNSKKISLIHDWMMDGNADEEDIFNMSSTNSSASRNDNQEAADDSNFDEESLYFEALSRKTSLVSLKGRNYFKRPNLNECVCACMSSAYGSILAQSDLTNICTIIRLGDLECWLSGYFIRIKNIRINGTGVS